MTQVGVSVHRPVASCPRRRSRWEGMTEEELLHPADPFLSRCSWATTGLTSSFLRSWELFGLADGLLKAAAKLTFYKVMSAHLVEEKTHFPS